MPTIRVPSDQPTIAAAISVAGPGDTIALEGGYVNESATVTVENLTFTGEFSNTGIKLTLGATVAAVFLGGTAPWDVADNALDNTITAPGSLAGPDGSNIITVTRGNDTVGGGANIGGFDTLIVSYGNSTLDIATTGDPADSSGTSAQYGDGANNSVDFGGFGRFRVTTGSGNDVIVTGNNAGTGNPNDVVSTGGGNDSIDTRGGDAIVNGGAGTDIWTANFSSDSAPITFNLNLGGTQALGNGSLATSIERIDLRTGGPSTIATRIGDVNDGLDDTIIADGDTTLTVGGGLDTFNGNFGGFDTLIVDYATETLAINTTGNPTTKNGEYSDGADTGVTFTDVERFWITTGSGDDNIRIGNGEDSINGGGRRR